MILSWATFLVVSMLIMGLGFFVGFITGGALCLGEPLPWHSLREGEIYHILKFCECGNLYAIVGKRDPQKSWFVVMMPFLAECTLKEGDLFQVVKKHGKFEIKAIKPKNNGSHIDILA